jgi:hypothetical protein
MVTGDGLSKRSRRTRSLSEIARGIRAAAIRTSSGNSRRSECRRATICTSIPGASTGPITSVMRASGSAPRLPARTSDTTTASFDSAFIRAPGAMSTAVPSAVSNGTTTPRWAVA